LLRRLDILVANARDFEGKHNRKKPPFRISMLYSQ